MSQITLSDVRSYLIQLALIKGRPPYDMCVVKQVRDAFVNNTDHALKDEIVNYLMPKPVVAVVEEKKEPKSIFRRNPRPEDKAANPKDVLEMMNWMGARTGRQTAMTELMGSNRSVLSKIKNGKIKCTEKMYKRMVKAKKQIIQMEREQANEKTK